MHNLFYIIIHTQLLSSRLILLKVISMSSRVKMYLYAKKSLIICILSRWIKMVWKKIYQSDICNFFKKSSSDLFLTSCKHSNEFKTCSLLCDRSQNFLKVAICSQIITNSGEKNLSMWSLRINTNLVAINLQRCSKQNWASMVLWNCWPAW